MENSNISYHLLVASSPSDFNNELNSRIKKGWIPIGNVTIAIAKAEYSSSREYAILLHKVS